MATLSLGLHGKNSSKTIGIGGGDPTTPKTTASILKMIQCLVTFLRLPLRQIPAKLSRLHPKRSPVHLVIPPHQPPIPLKNKINLFLGLWIVLKRLRLPHHQLCLQVQHPTPHLWPPHLSNANNRLGRPMVLHRLWPMLKDLPQNGTQEKQKGGRTQAGQGSAFLFDYSLLGLFFFVAVVLFLFFSVLAAQHLSCAYRLYPTLHPFVAPFGLAH
jgi:hypothetical protein